MSEERLDATLAVEEGEPYSPGLLHAAFEASVDAIAVMDCCGVMRSVNSAMLRVFGYQRGQLLGKNVSMLMPEPYRSHHDGYLKRYLETGEKRIIGIGREVVGLRRDGSEFPLDLSVGEAWVGKERLFVGLMRDITERRLLQQELEERQHELRLQRERLAHADRVATLGQMAAGIAHEVNQPFGAIANYAGAAQMLLGKNRPAESDTQATADFDRLNEVLDKIRNQALRGGEVVQRLRGLARHEGAETEEVDLHEVIESAVELALLQANFMGLCIENRCPEEPFYVFGDGVQLQQVLLNLLRNALESVNAHLCDDASQRTEESAAAVVVQVDLLDDRARVLVRDCGGGIDPDLVSRLMTPFVSGKQDGMGMGLAICDAIIADHGGHLWFRNHGYDGATFAFDLPLRPEEQIPPPSDVTNVSEHGSD